MHEASGMAIHIFRRGKMRFELNYKDGIYTVWDSKKQCVCGIGSDGGMMKLLQAELNKIALGEQVDEVFKKEIK